MGSNKGYTYAGSGSGVQGGSYQLNLFKGVGNSEVFSEPVLESVGIFEQAVSQDSNVQAINKYLHVLYLNRIHDCSPHVSLNYTASYWRCT